MSNHLAIATVTATLAHVLQEAVQEDVTGATVSYLRPDGATGPAPGAKVNIYMYQATPNPSWRNSDLPTRGGAGALMQRPRAALDLHYLLTFYGDEKDLVPQRLLGSTVRAIHSQPVLTREKIRETIKNVALNLGNSNLAEDIELVKFTPATLSLEELSKLWAVFFETQYTLSMPYQASVVLIETDQTPSSPLPVLERNVYAVPFRAPVIDKIALDAPGEGPITAESNIVISGRNLRGQVTLVSFSGSQLGPAAPGSVSDTEIKVKLPADLRAGVQAVQVEHQFFMGSPAVGHRGFESNVAAFVLAPIITDPTPPSFTVANPDPKPISGQVRVRFKPQVEKSQRVRLMLNEFNAPPTRPAHVYVFDAPLNKGITPPDVDTSRIRFHVADVAAGDYLVRVQVDGAESVLERDTDSTHPSFNQFIGPRVTIA